jgi:glutamine synthetase
MMSVILAAGLHGLDEKMDPGKRLDIDMYAEGHKVKGAKKLPLNLLDAIRNFDRDRYLKSALGDDFSAAYIKLKTAEWNQYCRHLTEWERQTTLDC